MSVIPVPATPEQSEPAETAATATRPLRLVTHEHTWQLRSVEYDDSFEVRRYECGGCDEVLYR